MIFFLFLAYHIFPHSPVNCPIHQFSYVQDQSTSLYSVLIINMPFHVVYIEKEFSIFP